jgi:hypothetical protein
MLFNSQHLPIYISVLAQVTHSRADRDDFLPTTSTANSDNLNVSVSATSRTDQKNSQPHFGASGMFMPYFFGLTFWDAFLPGAFLGGRPIGRTTNDSISERRTSVRPATFTVVNRPRRIRFAIA